MLYHNFQKRSYFTEALDIPISGSLNAGEQIFENPVVTFYFILHGSRNKFMYCMK